MRTTRIKRWVGALLLAGIVLGLVDVGWFVVDLLGMGFWTGGIEPRPIRDVLAGLGSVSMLVLAGLVISGLARSRERRKLLVVMLVLSVVAAAMCLSLPFIRVAEADITATGFNSDFYEIGPGFDVTLYNATSAPVTVCVGQSSVCDPAATLPPDLVGQGLTLAAGASQWIAFGPGDYPLTIAGPTLPGARVDTLVRSYYCPQEIEGVKGDDPQANPPYHWFQPNCLVTGPRRRRRRRRGRRPPPPRSGCGPGRGR
jgi:hypothetical protein